jgi:two-component system, OmpR family, response regulator
MSEPHILVVDDHHGIREPLAAYLSKHGMRMSQALDAAVARASLAMGCGVSPAWPMPDAPTR